MFRIFCVSILVVLSASWATSSIAQEQFGVWRFDCDQGPCQGHFALTSPDNNELAVGMSLIHEQSQNATTLVVKTPILTALPPGVRLEVGEDFAEQVILQFCDESGCTGFYQLTPDQVSRLRTADSATVRYFKYGQRNPKAYNFSIAGFGGVLDRLKK